MAVENSVYWNSVRVAEDMVSDARAYIENELEYLDKELDELKGKEKEFCYECPHCHLCRDLYNYTCPAWDMDPSDISCPRCRDYLEITGEMDEIEEAMDAFCEILGRLEDDD